VSRHLIIGVILIVALLGGVGIQQGVLTGYEQTTVTIEDSDTGKQLSTATVRVADTTYKQYVGLSETDSLADDEGMLFVHDTPGEHAYVMRGMSFPIEIIFIGADGEITTIHRAQPGDDDQFEGRGQFVLEVPVGFTDDNGISEGDTVNIDR
jgi:Uncharacterized conserved protein